MVVLLTVNMKVHKPSLLNKNRVDNQIAEAEAEDIQQTLKDPSSKAKRFSNSASGPDSKDAAYFDVEFEAERRGTNWDGEEKNEKVKRDGVESNDAAYFDVEFETKKIDVNGLGTPGDKRKREKIQLPGLQDDPHGEFDSGKR